MSRSVKVSIIKQNNSNWAKRQSNRKIRRTSLESIGNGNNYKKIYCCYDICDFNSGILSKYDLERMGIPEYVAKKK